jgi:TP901 family phage tail tape measure protein
MATVGFISITTGVDTRGFAKGFKTARGQLASFNAAIGSAKTALAGLGVALGARALGEQFVGTAVEVEKRVTGLAKATDLAGPGLAGMKAAIVGLSTELRGVSSEELFEIATIGAKSGKSGAALVAYTELVAKLAPTIDDIPVAELADSLAKIDSVFKLGAKGAGQLGSAIDKVADSGAASASGIIEFTQRVSGTAVASKVTAQQVIALGGALLDTGVNSELAATSTQRLLQAFAGSEDTFGSVVGFLQQLRQQDAATQLQSLKAIGIDGVQAQGVIQSLAQNVPSLTKYVGMANEEFKTLNQLTMSYNATAETTGARWENFKNKIEAIADTIGGLLLPTINSALDGFGGLGEGGNSAAVKITAALDSVSGGIGFVADVLAMVKNGFVAVQSVVSALGAAAVGVAAAIARAWSALTGLGSDTAQSLMDQADALARLSTEQYNASKAAMEAPRPSVAIQKALGERAADARRAAGAASRLKTAGPEEAAPKAAAAVAGIFGDTNRAARELRAARGRPGAREMPPAMAGGKGDSDELLESSKKQLTTQERSEQHLSRIAEQSLDVVSIL